jgi:hypothetical protein
VKRRAAVVAAATGVFIVVAGGVTEAVVAMSGSSPAVRHLVHRSAVTTSTTTTTQAPTTAPVARPLPTTTRPLPPPTTAPPAPAAKGHVMVIVMENQGYSDIIGNSSLPYINSLANTYVSLTNNYAMGHPSLPNYMEMTSGSSWGITSDCSPGGGCQGGAPTLLTEMDLAGVTWGGYFENMPSVGYAGGDTGGDDGYGNQLYQQHHNPFLYYPSLAGDLGRVKPYGSLLPDLNSANAPSFVFVAPNMVDDMHDGPLSTGDGWLSRQIPAIQASSWYRAGGTILIEWDEAQDSDNSGIGTAAGGRVPGIVISQAVRGHGAYATPVDTAGIVRSLADLYGLSRLNDAVDPSNGTLGNLL